MNHFIELIQWCIPGAEATVEAVRPYIKRSKFRKNDLVLQANTICKKARFICKGGCYMYRNADGKEEVSEFFFEGMLIGDHVSFIKQEPSEHDIRAMEDCEMEEISYEDLRHLYNTVPTMERVGRILSEQIYCSVLTRMSSYQNDSPEIRYQQLIEQRPALFQRVPQYLIASYLGVTPVGLSKIRKRLHDHPGQTSTD
jgi:CRP/FNR family transcriptional regulator, anaerobic regulatory protein